MNLLFEAERCRVFREDDPELGMLPALGSQQNESELEHEEAHIYN